MIAVMGASGNVGSKAAEALLEAGHKVRVLQHTRPVDELERRGAEVVSGDATRRDDLKRFFQGVDAALVLLPDNLADPNFVATRSAMAGNIAQTLDETGVGHVVAISAFPVDRPGIRGPAAGLREFEALLCGLDATSVLFLRPAAYMDYLLFNLPMIRSQGVNGGVVGPDATQPMVATIDVAREAARELAAPGFSGVAVKPMVGPEDVTMRHATALLRSILGLPELHYVQFPPDQAKAALVESGVSQEAAQLLVDMQLDVDSGAMFGGVERKAEWTTPTTLNQFLDSALSRSEVSL